MFRLPEITYPLTIDTIGKMLALGHEMSAHCRNPGCGHHSRINMVALGHRIGFDHSCKEQYLLRHFYCPKCRAGGRDDKRVGFIHHVLTVEHCEWPREREIARQKAVRARN